MKRENTELIELFILKSFMLTNSNKLHKIKWELKVLPQTQVKPLPFRFTVTAQWQILQWLQCFSLILGRMLYGLLVICLIPLHMGPDPIISACVRWHYECYNSGCYFNSFLLCHKWLWKVLNHAKCRSAKPLYLQVF